MTGINPATKMPGRAGRMAAVNEEIAYCRSTFNNSNGGQKVKHGRQARTPKR